MMFKIKDTVWEFGKRTYIMGILNVTPDSFSDGGRFTHVDHAVEHGFELIGQGADIIDVGGESTRPGSQEVGEEEELARILPVVEKLHALTQVPISVDTYKARVAQRCLEAGADLINDIWGLQREPEIARVAAHFGAPVVVMHNQNGTVYSQDIMGAMIAFFEESLEIAAKAGLSKESIVLDPGIGFGKTVAQNIEILGRLSELKVLGYPLLLGTSRKSTIGRILDLPPEQRVEGTLATTVLGIQQGIDIIRVHDVMQNRRAALVADAIVRGYAPWTASV